ncbi:hypothetical protein QF037_010181 [Streptomyces canus]|nr:hypothetical protein [Streptomyces canus]
MAFIDMAEAAARRGVCLVPEEAGSCQRGPSKKRCAAGWTSHRNFCHYFLYMPGWPAHC